MKKWIAKLLTAAMCCSLLAVPVSAYERINTEQEASISLHYHDAEREKDIRGMEIRLYKVADMSDSVRFTVTEDFTDASVFRDESFTLENLDAEKWAALADTLTAYVALERGGEEPIMPAASGVTDEEGKVSFAELEVGLYLLLCNGNSKLPILRVSEELNVNLRSELCIEVSIRLITVIILSVLSWCECCNMNLFEYIAPSERVNSHKAVF